MDNSIPKCKSCNWKSSSTWKMICDQCDVSKVTLTTKGACVFCPGGQRPGTDAGTPCIDCGNGNFQDPKDLIWDCQRCAVGTYTNTSRSEQCLACPTFSSTDKEGATSVTDCRCSRGNCFTRHQFM